MPIILTALYQTKNKSCWGQKTFTSPVVVTVLFWTGRLIKRGYSCFVVNRTKQLLQSTGGLYNCFPVILPLLTIFFSPPAINSKLFCKTRPVLISTTSLAVCVPEDVVSPLFSVELALRIALLPRICLNL